MTDPAPLPAGISSRRVETATGLSMHLLEAGDPADPLLLLLHGFPELSYSWRKIMGPLAAAGHHVVAPDQRGYGLTTGWKGGWDDVADFTMPLLVRDVVALSHALGKPVKCLIGHDFGSPVTAWASLIRPDLFPRAVLLSAPFGGPPGLAVREDGIHNDLKGLARPRKHYQWYYSTPEAAPDMDAPPQGLGAFLRAYYHMKSADWPNAPHRLGGWRADELAKMPTYYIMYADATMPQSVASEMPDGEAPWLTDTELQVYVDAFSRTGFQPSLNWYRCQTDPHFRREISVYAGRKIEVPHMFIAGREDWGWAQVPGALEAMEANPACQAVHLIPGAGHWVQQEQPEAVTRLILDFLA